MIERPVSQSGSESRDHISLQMKTSCLFLRSKAHILNQFLRIHPRSESEGMEAELSWVLGRDNNKNASAVGDGPFVVRN